MSIEQEYNKVTEFENKLAAYTNTPYVVAVDSCTSAIDLCLDYIVPESIILPNNSYVGVVGVAHRKNIKVYFHDIKWSGIFCITPTNIIDSARRLTSNMYIAGTLMCLSFGYKKHLKIGRGGAILTDNYKAAHTLKLLRNSGKDITKNLPNQVYSVLGRNANLHPDLALRGSTLLDQLPKHNEDLPYEYYGDLEKQVDDVIRCSPHQSPFQRTLE